MTAVWVTRAYGLARMGLLVAAAPLALSACADGGDSPPPAPIPVAAPEPAPPPDDAPPVVGNLEHEETAPRCDDGSAKQKIEELQGNVEALTSELNHAAAMGDAAGIQALKEDISSDNDWIVIFEGLKPCPPPQTASVASGANAGPPAGASAPTIALAPMRLGALPIMGASAQIGYAHNFPSAGDGTDAFALGGQALIGASSYGLVGGVKGSATPWYQGNLELQGSWGDSFTSGTTTSAGSFNAAYLMNAGPLRFGPVGGYQGSTTGDVTSHTYAYGGFGEAFFNDKFSASVRGYGFSMDPGLGGWAVGAGIKLNPTPDLTLSASGDYQQWQAPSDFYQYQITAQAEFKPCPRTPLSLFGGYTFMQSGYPDFPSYHPSSSEVFVGLRVWANAPPVMTLEDRERNGPVIGLIPNF